MRVPRAQPNETVEPERHHVRLQAGLGNSYVEIAGQFFLQYYPQGVMISKREKCTLSR
jgi:hypothetical protein